MTDCTARALRVHRIAARPAHVYGIAAGIVASLGAFDVAAALHGLDIPESLPLRREARIFRLMMRDGDWYTLAGLFVWLTLLWASFGGGLTRRLLQELRGERPDELRRAIRCCLRTALLMPSAMASACFLLLLAAPAAPWTMLAVMPVWLCAGFLYAPLTEHEVSLAAALADASRRLRDVRPLLRRQLRHLVSFCVSTAAVYALVLLWIMAVLAVVGAHGHGLAPALIAPAALYALGFTTANLKALQLDLYLGSEPVNAYGVRRASAALDPTGTHGAAIQGGAGAPHSTSYRRRP